MQNQDQKEIYISLTETKTKVENIEKEVNNLNNSFENNFNKMFDNHDKLTESLVNNQKILIKQDQKIINILEDTKTLNNKSNSIQLKVSELEKENIMLKNEIQDVKKEVTTAKKFLWITITATVGMVAKIILNSIT
jgi:hypothetical protein